MEKINLLSNVVIPDGIFWYTIATILAGALLWITQRFISKVDTILSELSKSVNSLITITRVHDTQIHNLQEDVKNLQERSS